MSNVFGADINLIVDFIDINQTYCVFKPAVIFNKNLLT